jgi:hypothetical protein
MKRDMELIRTIMLKIEKDDYSDNIDNFSLQKVLFHKKLLIDAGFLSGNIYLNTESSKPEVGTVIIREITWEGYELLELLKNDKKFTYLKDIGKTLPLETLKIGIKLALERFIDG